MHFSEYNAYKKGKLPNDANNFIYIAKCRETTSTNFSIPDFIYK